MPRNTIADLRNHLFETIEMLKDEEKPMDLERAKTISAVAQTIINSAKVEIDLINAVSASSPGSKHFFNMPEESRDIDGAALRIAARNAAANLARQEAIKPKGKAIPE